jgi:hypothetical protein
MLRRGRFPNDGLAPRRRLAYPRPWRTGCTASGPRRGRRRRSPGPQGAGDDGRVGLAIFPFRAAAGADETWSSGVADLLATALDGTVGRAATAWTCRSACTGRAAPSRFATVGVSGIDFAATRSPEALKAYIAARDALRRGAIDSANTAIDRAVGLDSTFVLALVEAIAIKSWASTCAGARAHTAL